MTGNESDWRGYEPIETILILLKEMLAKGMLPQKQLMQCPPGRVELGTSATAAFRTRCQVI